MDRDIYKNLDQWKSSPRRKPLILNGARQVGKTHALKHFAQTRYTKSVYLNFEKDQRLHALFNTNLNPHEILSALRIHSEVIIEPETTLIIFDEIQECPEALNSLKYFCEEANEFHIVAAGSLLGVKTNHTKGFPVGKVNFLTLYPLSFFEFLSALGQDQTRSFLEELSVTEEIPLAIHQKLLEILKLYTFIGGMPEVIASYVKERHLDFVREIQEEILSAYEKDFAKHAPPTSIMKISTIWDHIPPQLAKENKKFVFAQIRKSARYRDYDESIEWLKDAGLIYKCYQIASPKRPLKAYIKSGIFKLYMLDVGLLGAKSHLSPKILLEGNKLLQEFKGALIENFVAQELICCQHQDLSYWSSSGTAEVDFLIENRHIYPLEVKSGESTKKKSLLVYDKKYAPPITLRASTLNLAKQERLRNIPLYLVSQLSRFLSP